MTQSEVHVRIVAKIEEIARGLGRNPAGLLDDVVVMETGLLDSAGLLELLVWMDAEFGVEIDPGELTVDNFGSVNQMVRFLVDRGVGG